MKNKLLRWSLTISITYLFFYHIFLVQIEAPHIYFHLFGNFMNVILSGYVPSAGIVLLLDQHERSVKSKQYRLTVQFHLDNIESSFKKSFEVLPVDITVEEQTKFKQNFNMKKFKYKEVNGTILCTGYELVQIMWETIDKELSLLLMNNPLGLDETRGYVNNFKNNDFYRIYLEVTKKMCIGGRDEAELINGDLKSLIVPHVDKEEKIWCLIPIRLYEEFKQFKKNTEKMYK